ncbi:MAG TPA: glycosylasparaginase [Ignavibacteria bacterium]|nr:glycosylasparaginase [Ignavibacteria bacterium]
MKQTRRQFLITGSLALTGAAITKTYPKIKNKVTVKGPVSISTWSHGYEANKVSMKVMQSGKTSLDAVELGIHTAENNPKVTSVGYGGYPDAEGNVTLDASIMNWEGNAGAVGFLQEIKNPISVARLVMEKTPHIMLVGAGALQFALKNGFKKQDILTPKAKEAWERWKKKKETELQKKENHDTVGLLAIDKKGNMSGGVSTSGIAFKTYGRVGDSPIIGAGLFVDNEVGGACSTGWGELAMKSVGSFLTVEKMREGYSPQKACEYVIKRISKEPYFGNKQICFLAMNKEGEFGAFSLYKGFAFAIANEQGNRLLQSDYLIK